MSDDALAGYLQEQVRACEDVTQLAYSSMKRAAAVMEEQVLVSKDAQRLYQRQLSSPGGPQADQQSEAAAGE
eukprot:7928971-Alexandrium_andersonii.AAC.1